MERSKTNHKLKHLLFGLSLSCSSAVAIADYDSDGWGGYDRHDYHKKSYSLQGPCAFLPAARATEFHGNPDRSKLNLGMAGNQWVVFDAAMREFNRLQGNDPTQPAHRENDAGRFTLADLNDDANRYFIELIPPGQIRNQIKSGCMLLGNDDERNFLPGNFQVDFDVFASTNYNLMQNLANAGFIDEAVPYIKNRLDLMVVDGNPKGIGTDSYTANADFDIQFDIIMDLLSGDVVASNLDHINEGIHKASNAYMGAAHDYVRDHDDGATISMSYTLADGTEVSGDMTATAWIQTALANVATPQPGSPGARRLTDSGDALAGDAGETHSGNAHDLVAQGCVYDNGDFRFCEFATLNKASTHESRVHHVETPNGLVGVDGFEPVDAGFVWITEVAYQLNNGNTAITGMSGQDISNLGIPRPADGPAVNSDKTYSLALLATSKNKWRGRQFINFLRSAEGQAVYTNGGFTGLSAEELDGGNCFSRPEGGVSVATPRDGAGSCDDWLWNGN